MLRAGVPSFCLLCQSYAIREVEAGADHEADAAEHVEDAAPDVRGEWHRYACSQAAIGKLFLSVFMLADYADG